MVLFWFQALSIETEEDIHILASYFMHLKGKPDPGEEEKVCLFYCQDSVFITNNTVLAQTGLGKHCRPRSDCSWRNPDQGLHCLPFHLHLWTYLAWKDIFVCTLGGFTNHFGCRKVKDFYGNEQLVPSKVTKTFI